MTYAHPLRNVLLRFVLLRARVRMRRSPEQSDIIDVDRRALLHGRAVGPRYLVLDQMLLRKGRLRPQTQDVFVNALAQEDAVRETHRQHREARVPP